MQDCKGVMQCKVRKDEVLPYFFCVSLTIAFFSVFLSK